MLKDSHTLALTSPHNTLPQAVMMGDPSAKRMLAEASEIHALQSSSHMVTGCYDHAICVWQACDAERVVFRASCLAVPCCLVRGGSSLR